jgi:hypothetical protein
MLLPTNPLVMWAYTKLGDPRWQWGDQFFALRQDPGAVEPHKIGLFHATSWVAYLLGSDLFFKWSAADPAGVYPDFGCSLEIFTNRFMMELETLGPITKVEPNQTVEHIEHWMLMRNVALADLPIAPWARLSNRPFHESHRSQEVSQNEFFTKPPRLAGGDSRGIACRASPPFPRLSDEFLADRSQEPVHFPGRPRACEVL